MHDVRIDLRQRYELFKIAREIHDVDHDSGCRSGCRFGMQNLFHLNMALFCILNTTASTIKHYCLNSQLVLGKCADSFTVIISNKEYTVYLKGKGEALGTDSLWNISSSAFNYLSEVGKVVLMSKAVLGDSAGMERECKCKFWK